MYLRMIPESVAKVIAKIISNRATSTLHNPEILVILFFLYRVTKYLCSGCFFFRQKISTFQLFIFDGKGIDVLRKKKIHLDFFCKVKGLKDCHSGQFGTINARYNSRY